MANDDYVAVVDGTQRHRRRRVVSSVTAVFHHQQQLRHSISINIIVSIINIIFNISLHHHLNGKELLEIWGRTLFCGCWNLCHRRRERRRLRLPPSSGHLQ
ncbi:hypothetical protein Hanom_Chr04g00316491 [Helianthus anomalus]